MLSAWAVGCHTKLATRMLTGDSGPNNDQLYVTTAHCGACGGDGSRQASYPDSGNLFVVDFAGEFAGGEWRFPFAG